MRREDLKDLSYIVHFDNVISIFQNGILSQCFIKRFTPQISFLPGCSRQEGVEVVSSGNVSAQLRSPLHLRKKSDAFQAKIQLRVFRDLCAEHQSRGIGSAGVIISDRNASSDYALFKPSPEGLEIVDKDLVFAGYWNHPDAVEKYKHVSIKCAEVLVPDRVPARYISGTYVSCPESKEALEMKLSDAGLSINVVVNTYLFFK